jgi:hypothetical protein
MTNHKERPFLRSKAILLSALLVAFLSCKSAQNTETAAKAASPQTNPPQAAAAKETTAQAAPKDDQSEEDKTVIAVSKAIRKNHLTDRDDECLAFQFDARPGEEFYVVEVRENHHYAKCGGDPKTSPRLFTVRVSKKTGKMSTDQGSSSGAYRPIEEG